MTKAVFTTKPRPTYDDLPEVQYHFPRTYLNQARAAVGDWIVYYEPRRASADPSSRGGRQAYFAIARVTAIEPDQDQPDYFYAYVGDYLDFDRPVPFREGGRYYEAGLMRPDGRTSKGAFGRAIRPISDSDFAPILAAGFSTALAAAGHDLEYPETDVVRPLVETTLMRPFRDETFRKHVRLAYENRCAISGLRLINGGGRPEVHAAHIKPVASAGPDSVRNGIALSGTLHWMFDRGLISIDDDFRVLRATSLSEDVSRLLSANLTAPADPMLRPHPSFLRFHRQNVFKG